MLALNELRIIKYSSLTYLFSTETNLFQEVLIHTPSLNPSFKALDEDVYYATKVKVALEWLIQISTQFPVSQGVTLGETAKVWQEITLLGKCESRTGDEKNLEWRKITLNVDISFSLSLSIIKIETKCSGLIQSKRN